MTHTSPDGSICTDTMALFKLPLYLILVISCQWIFSTMSDLFYKAQLLAEFIYLFIKPCLHQVSKA